MKKLVIYRGRERIVGTAEEISNILGMRLYVFNRFLKNGKTYNNPRLKDVRLSDEPPIVKSAMAEFVKRINTPGTPEHEAVAKRSPNTNLSKKVSIKQKLFCFEKDGIYLNAKQNYALCIASDHQKKKYRFIAIYNTPNGYKLASASNEGAVTSVDDNGETENGYKVMYQIDINGMSADDMKEFITMRNWIRQKNGIAPEIFVPTPVVETKIIETVKEPGFLDRAVIEDRLKNLEAIVEQLRGRAQ